MTLSFETKLRNYARLGLLHGLGFDQKPRPLFIDSFQTEDHGGLIPLLGEEAFKLGVETVDLRCRCPELERAMFLYAPEKFKVHEPSWVNHRAHDIVNRDGARIALIGNGELGLMDGVDPKYPIMFKSAYFKANEPYTTRRMKMQQPWTLFAVPTHAWAKKLNMSIEGLWDFLFMITGADQDDPIAFAQRVDDNIQRRCRILNQLGIRKLHFVGFKTHLTVGLSEKAQWLGGRKASEDGTYFEPNWPSFEIYTTPDWRKTEGYVQVTMPTVPHGPIITGLWIQFKKGRVVFFRAEDGTDAFQKLISRDVGASQLGEIALVGLDSPLSKFVEPHFCTLLDENKRCHMAVGSGYPATLIGGRTASDEWLAEEGCNDSSIHQDMMISDETTSVSGLDADGNIIAQIMENGRWIGGFV